MTWAVVPVKQLDMVKQRLSGVLSRDRRKALYLAMLNDVLENLGRVPSVEGIVVVTPDPRVEDLACSFASNVLFIRETGPPSLNGALNQAARFLRGYNASSMLVIPGDVPLLKPEEVERLVGESENVSVIVAPDKEWRGTNGLLLTPPDVIPPCFGPDSLRAHLERAREKGVAFKVIPVSSLRWDVDQPADLLHIIESGPGRRTYGEILRHALCPGNGLWCSGPGAGWESPDKKI